MGKYTKTKEGLFCHHIMENEYENISNKEFIAHYKYTYEYHHKENLVYCDLIEHMILHALITKETNGDRSFKGLVEFLIPIAEEWYIDGDELLKDVEVYQELLEELREEERRELEREDRIQRHMQNLNISREEF